MELVNFWIIVVCATITVVWALRKRHEISTMKISFFDDAELHHEIDQYEMEALRKQQEVTKDSA